MSRDEGLYSMLLLIGGYESPKKRCAKKISLTIFIVILESLLINFIYILYIFYVKFLSITPIYITAISDSLGDLSHLDISTITLNITFIHSSYATLPTLDILLLYNLLIDIL